MLLPALARATTISRIPSLGTANLHLGAGPSIFRSREPVVILPIPRLVQLQDSCSVVDAMKQPMTQEAAIRDTKEGHGFGLGAALTSIVTKLLETRSLMHRVLNRSLGLLGMATVLDSKRRNHQVDLPEDAPAFERKEQGHRVRQSRRVVAQSVVVVEGQFSDGSLYLDSTPALVLSAHGCLVTLAKPVTIGESLVVRNSSTLQERYCQVVYIGKKCAGRTEVGLGFEVAAPDFWGIELLPSERKAVLQ